MNNWHKLNVVLILITILWGALICFGLGILFKYENTPGLVKRAPLEWPGKSQIPRAPDNPTLVMFAHPHCSCTRASIEELARLMTQCQEEKVKAFVLFIKPAAFPEEWVKTDLWNSAAAIPGVTPLLDKDGAEARHFKAYTSGQTLLYDAQGRLLFNGGITGSRGHSGDNMGRSAVVSLLTQGKADQKETFVFGCSLFEPGLREIK